MPKINTYVDISEVERESRKDYIDRHSPFITAPDSVKAGETFTVTVTMGNEYTHPADDDHYISQISLFDGETMLASANLLPSLVSNAKSNVKTSFSVIATKKMKLTAVAYCTKHGLWTNDAVEVAVEE
jgi:superoxide reductase